MRKILSFILLLTMSISIFSNYGCGKESVIIYTSTEDYNMELMEEKLSEKFPNYNIILSYYSTNDIASKIVAEGENSECDIVYAEEYAYLDKMIENNVLASFNNRYDYSKFEDDTYSNENKNYVLPSLRVGGGIILNKSILQRYSINEPTCYDDLLKSEYKVGEKRLVSMASPKASGTGYMFYLSLINARGEKQALSYFDSLTNNVLAYESSGSKPVNKIVTGDVAVGFGMISQAVEKINNGNKDIKIIFFSEGAPFNLYGTSVVKGKETRQAVMEVMDYLYSDYIEESCSRFYPEKIIKGKTFTVENFPENIDYADMSNNTLQNKENLVAKWLH